MKATVEICVQGIRSAFAASEGDADRVELCEDLAVGGVTPSAGMIMAASLGLDIPVHVLIRPRGGDFLYDRDEIEVMRHDIGFARDFAGGVVLGLLDDKLRVHWGRTSELVELARPLSVTFHKAFDAARDPFEALDDLIELGVDRVLTSGGKPTAREGLAVLAELTRRAEGRIAIMAGGTIRLEDIRPLIDAGIREIHVGSAVLRDGVADPSKVRNILEAAHV